MPHATKMKSMTSSPLITRRRIIDKSNDSQTPQKLTGGIPNKANSKRNPVIRSLTASAPIVVKSVAINFPTRLCRGDFPSPSVRSPHVANENRAVRSKRNRLSPRLPRRCIPTRRRHKRVTLHELQSRFPIPVSESARTSPIKSARPPDRGSLN